MSQWLHGISQALACAVAVGSVACAVLHLLPLRVMPSAAGMAVTVLQALGRGCQQESWCGMSSLCHKSLVLEGFRSLHWFARLA